MIYRRDESFLSSNFRMFLKWDRFVSGRVAVLLAALCLMSLMKVSSGQTPGQQQLLQILAVPWMDRHPSDIHRLSHQTTTCSVAIGPVQAEEELTKGTFVHFVLAGSTYIVRASFFNGRYCSVEVFRAEFVDHAVHFRQLATTKLQYQILDLKADVCDDKEAYIVAILTRDGYGTEPQLLVFKPDEKDRSGRTFIIAHNGQLSSMKGVSDVSIQCFQDHVVFGLAASTTFLPTGSKELFSSIRIWSPKSRTVIKQLTVETTNAVAVVAFESGRCLMHVFLQKGNSIYKGPMDSMVYCVMSESRTVWQLTLIQRLNLCEVSGVELYLNSKQELGMFVAISKTSEEMLGCPRTSLSMKWTGRQFVNFGNISVKAVSNFYYLPTTCCNLLVARHVGAERALTIVGSTEPLFEGVHKVEFVAIEKRNFLLISFAIDSNQGALHEIFCSQPTNFKMIPYGQNRQLPGPPPAAMMQVAPPQTGMIPGPPFPAYNGPIQVQPQPPPPMPFIPYPGPPVSRPPVQIPGPQYFLVPENRDRPMGNVPMGNVPIGNVPMVNVPQVNVPRGNMPIVNVPMVNVPRGNVPMGNVPMGNVPMGNVSIGRVPGPWQLTPAPVRLVLLPPYPNGGPPPIFRPVVSSRPIIPSPAARQRKRMHASDVFS